MPLYHCTHCHHEWEGMWAQESLCDWCGSKGFVLQEKTPLELSIADMIKENTKGSSKDD